MAKEGTSLRQHVIRRIMREKRFLKRWHGVAISNRASQSYKFNVYCIRSSFVTGSVLSLSTPGGLLKYSQCDDRPRWHGGMGKHFLKVAVVGGVVLVSFILLLLIVKSQRP